MHVTVALSFPGVLLAAGPIRMGKSLLKHNADEIVAVCLLPIKKISKHVKKF